MPRPPLLGGRRRRRRLFGRGVLSFAPFFLLVASLWGLLLVPGGVTAFNIWPDLPGLRYQSLYKVSNQQHDAHPTHPQPSGDGDEGLSVVDMARRRLWRWAVWRRLYHASAVSVLKQHQQRPPAVRFGRNNKQPASNQLDYTPPRAFELAVPDAGPVTVASSDRFSSIYLVTRAASQYQKSLVYVNGTEVSGHLRNPITLPSSSPSSFAAAVGLPSDSSSLPLTTTTTSSSSADVSLCLHGEFSIHKPAYLHITPLRAGSRPMLWVTQFSLTSRGSITGIDLFSSTTSTTTTTSSSNPPQPQQQHNKVMKLRHAFSWPNEVHNIPPGVVKGTSEEAMLVADGFLMPGRSDGGLYIVEDPGRPSEAVTKITRHRAGWFYHKAVWLHDLMGQGARACVLTARATKPFFGESAGELVLLFQPEGPFPLAEWNTPWEEVVLVRGPDVMFDVTDLDPNDDIIEVFAAEFFTQRLTLHRIRKGDWRTRRQPRLVSSEIIDDTLGPAYSVVVADLKGQGRPSHVLVSSHECQYEGMPPAAAAAAAAAAAEAAALEQQQQQQEEDDDDMALEGGGARRNAAWARRRDDGGSCEENNHIGVDGEEEEEEDDVERTRRRRRKRGAAATIEEPPVAAAGGGVDSAAAAAAAGGRLKGGSLFAYEIPCYYSTEGGGVRTWRRTTIATGFQVKTWGQINPGAPGFSYLFYPHSAMAKVPGQRPSILLAGDCSHAAYVYRPVGSGEDEIRYELMCEINCGGTVGSLAVAHLPLAQLQQEQQPEVEEGGGWAKLFLPNFDTNKVYVFSFQPGARSVLGGGDPIAMSSSSSHVPEQMEQREAERLARRQEEELVLHHAKSYGRARADLTKLP